MSLRPWLEDLVRDVGYGLRTLRRRPGLTATAVLSLALGIGANAGVFSLVDQILLRLLPVREPERLVLLEWRGPSLPFNQIGEGNLLSYPLCLDLQRQDRVLEGAFCRHSGDVYLSAGGRNELVLAEIVSGSYFSVLGVQAERGRLIGASDDRQLEQHPVVVVSHDYWRNSLGSPADIVGRSVLAAGGQDERLPLSVDGVEQLRHVLLRAARR